MLCFGDRHPNADRGKHLRPKAKAGRTNRTRQNRKNRSQPRSPIRMRVAVFAATSTLMGVPMHTVLMKMRPRGIRTFSMLRISSCCMTVVHAPEHSETQSLLQPNCRWYRCAKICTSLHRRNFFCNDVARCNGILRSFFLRFAEPADPDSSTLRPIASSMREAMRPWSPHVRTNLARLRRHLLAPSDNLRRLRRVVRVPRFAAFVVTRKFFVATQLQKKVGWSSNGRTFRSRKVWSCVKPSNSFRPRALGTVTTPRRTSGR